MGMRSGKARGPYVGPAGSGGGTPTVPTSVPTWFPCIAFDYTMFTGFAALVGDVAIYSLLAMGTIEGMVIKTSTLFTGPGITNLSLSAGIVGNLAKYLSPFDAKAAVSNTNFGLANVLGMESFGGATSIRLAAVATGANLSALTQGAGCLFIKGAILTP